MAEITAAGYQLVRDLIESSAGFNFIELQKADGTPWERLQVDTDVRCVWTTLPDGQTLELTVTISGDDIDITLPQELGKSELYENAVGGSALSSETFSATTLENENDEVVVKHRVQVPQVV